MSDGGPNLRSGGLSQGTFNIRGRRLGGKYEIIREIGSGGMGKVYLAHETPANRYVAVKILHPSYFMDARTVTRFLQEAKVCLSLRHPNTTAVFDFGTTQEGLHYMVMELLKGRALFDILDQYRTIELQWAVKISAQICDSLSEAHALGIVHRDLKPENVFIEPRPGHPAFVKVLDFGIAKDMTDPGTSSGLTSPGEVFGTPTYMSPEQASGKELDGRSDIYSLGVMIYEMLCGVPPFQGAPLTVLMAHAHEEAPPLPEPVRSKVPPQLLALLESMLSKDPNQRPSTTKEVRSGLVKSVAVRKETGRGMKAATPPESPPDLRATPSSPGMTKCSIELRNVASSNPCRLVRSGSTSGVLHLSGDLVQHGDRMVLVSHDPGLPQARLIVDVSGFTSADGKERCPLVHWVRIVCAGGLEELQTVLTVLGMANNRLSLDGGELTPDEFLVYEPLTEQVRRVTLGA